MGVAAVYEGNDAVVIRLYSAALDSSTDTDFQLDVLRVVTAGRNALDPTRVLVVWVDGSGVPLGTRSRSASAGDCEHCVLVGIALAELTSVCPASGPGTAACVPAALILAGAATILCMRMCEGGPVMIDPGVANGYQYAAAGHPVCPTTWIVEYEDEIPPYQRIILEAWNANPSSFSGEGQPRSVMFTANGFYCCTTDHRITEVRVTVRDRVTYSPVAYGSSKVTQHSHVGPC